MQELAASLKHLLQVILLPPLQDILSSLHMYHHRMLDVDDCLTTSPQPQDKHLKTGTGTGQIPINTQQ
jgi:hypothetical protein